MKLKQLLNLPSDSFYAKLPGPFVSLRSLPGRVLVGCP
jgi:hypothetical protein